MDLFGDDSFEDSVLEDENSDYTSLSADSVEITPRTIQNILGHDTQQQSLLESYHSGRMPHGLILSGPKGIGKASFAYLLTKFLLQNGLYEPNPTSIFDEATPSPKEFCFDPQSQAVRLVLSGAHPDVLTIEPEYDASKDRRKDNISVSEIRKVAPFLTKTASMGSWRIVIIDDADTMNRNAQNALLKVLEEPPKNTILLLVTHRIGAMIPTIRSRCRTINFRPLKEAHFNIILAERGHMLSMSEADSVMAMTQGSIGQALTFIEDGGIATLNQILDLFKAYPRFSWAEIHALGDRLAKTGPDKSYDHFTTLLPWIMSQLIKSKARGTKPESLQLADNDALQTLVEYSSLESLLKICENLDELFARTSKSNLDKRQAVLSAFSKIAA